MRPAAPRAARAAVLCLAVATVLPGCVSRGRPRPGPTETVATLAHGYETFLRARGGRRLEILALSGGGKNGAFGAGALAGWTAAGRPRFDVVTGVSTGALLATHAFLGTPADDAVLREAYRDGAGASAICPRPAIALPFAAAMNDARPLIERIGRLLPDGTIDRVAAATEGGRRLLLVATTDLDAGAFVVHDVGALARARAYERYRAVVLASASPPGVLDPVFLDGRMHADGSTITSIFVPDFEATLGARRPRDAASGGPVAIHALVNTLVDPYSTCIERRGLSIGLRAFDIVLHGLLAGSLWRIDGIAKREGASLRVLSIPSSSQPDGEDPFDFDAGAMRRLYDVGARVAGDPAAWVTKPPSLEAR